MKIKLSKSQWEEIGKKAGWMKVAAYGTGMGEELVPDPVKGRVMTKEEIDKAFPSAGKMMPGQTPYTPKELKQLHQMVGDAAMGDPGEQGEAEVLKKYDDNVSRRRHIKVTFSDGDSLETEINGTVPEIQKYYLHPLNNVPQDYDLSHPEKTRTVTGIEFLK